MTRVGLDHMEFLGDTLAAIAREKAAIFRKGVPAVVSAQPPEALAVIEACAAAAGAPLLLEGRDFSLDGARPLPGPADSCSRVWRSGCTAATSTTTPRWR